MNRTQAAVLVLLGLLAFGVGVQTHVWEAEDRFSASAADSPPDADVPDDAVLAYAALSEPTQSVFDRALANGGTVTVYGSANAPTDLQYADDTSTYGTGLYYVQKGGTYYRFVPTRVGHGLGDLLVFCGSLLVGVALVAGGLARVYRDAAAPR